MNTPTITLSPEKHAELSRCVRSAAIRQRDGHRARVVLLAGQGCTRVETARLTCFSLPVLTCWCQCFQAQQLDGLLDKPGRGRKPFLPLEALRCVLAQVTQPCIGEPRWSSRSTARAARISASSVHKLWTSNDLKPQLPRTFKLSNDPSFEEKFWDVIGRYLSPPVGALVFCCDEKSQVQALGRTPPCLPLGIDHIHTQSHDYVRHGTLTLFTALDYLQGRLFSSIESLYRHQEWLEFLKKINRETSKHLQLHFMPTLSSWMTWLSATFAISRCTSTRGRLKFGTRVEDLNHRPPCPTKRTTNVVRLERKK